MSKAWPVKRDLGNGKKRKAERNSLSHRKDKKFFFYHKNIKYSTWNSLCSCNNSLLLTPLQFWTTSQNPVWEFKERTWDCIWVDIEIHIKQQLQDAWVETRTQKDQEVIEKIQNMTIWGICTIYSKDIRIFYRKGQGMKIQVYLNLDLKGWVSPADEWFPQS